MLIYWAQIVCHFGCGFYFHLLWLRFALRSFCQCLIWRTTNYPLDSVPARPLCHLLPFRHILVWCVSRVAVESKHSRLLLRFMSFPSICQSFSPERSRAAWVYYKHKKHVPSDKEWWSKYMDLAVLGFYMSWLIKNKYKFDSASHKPWQYKTALR